MCSRAAIIGSSYIIGQFECLIQDKKLQETCVLKEGMGGNELSTSVYKRSD